MIPAPPLCFLALPTNVSALTRTLELLVLPANSKASCFQFSMELTDNLTLKLLSCLALVSLGGVPPLAALGSRSCRINLNLSVSWELQGKREADSGVWL